MRYPAPWMIPLDERTLEILQKEGACSPAFIAREVVMFASSGRVRERCKMLADAGLVDPMSEDWEMFELTEEGMRYLKGNLDVRHQPTPKINNQVSI